MSIEPVPLQDSSAAHAAGEPTRTHVLAAGDLLAVFEPMRGMVCVSLKHRGEEILSRVASNPAASFDEVVSGIALRYPFANRVRNGRYAFDGRCVQLDPASSWLSTDVNGTPSDGVRPSRLDWRVVEASDRRLRARISWTRDELLQVFPFPHDVELSATLDGLGLTIAVAVLANAEARVPVSFGLNPRLTLPGLPREKWRLSMPAMAGIVLDEQLLPVGERTPLPPYDGRLADLDFDHGFALPTTGATMSLEGNGRRISIDFADHFPYAWIEASSAVDSVTLAPMTAAPDALRSHEDLPVVVAGERFTATCRIRVESTSNSLH
ncbi:aldose 1-epimerase [Lysobacter sp. TY2-98]|uniref:aldose 1-epimerase n=1 Tax=Lysobacter sp. TY2-98 TaxID=2290922 RepID=UPI0013B3F4BA|nr:aldose 1-epimerase [Lysobacter sp. TY2-98]